MTPEEIARRRAYATAALNGLAADAAPIPVAMARDALGLDVRGTPSLTVWSQWVAYRAWLLADAMMAREAGANPAPTLPTLTWELPADAELAPIRRSMAKMVEQFGGRLTEVVPKEAASGN